MRTNGIVFFQPEFGDVADFLKRTEGVDIQHLGAEGALESLNVGILRGLAGLDVTQLDSVFLGPFSQLSRDELRAIVYS